MLIYNMKDPFEMGVMRQRCNNTYRMENNSSEVFRTVNIVFE